MSTLEAHAPVPLSPPGRSKRILANVLIIHVLVIALPLGWVLLMAQFTDRDETFSINIVDTPSVGPVTAEITTRTKPAEKPAPEPVPEPAPELPAPAPEPVVDLPPVPTPKPVAEPVVNLPAPRPAAKPEPKVALPSPPKPPAPPNKNASKSADDSRKLTNQKVKGGGSNNNPDVPIGKIDAAQKFGEKFSNTAQGGPDKMSQYAGMLSMFLKAQWQNFVPSRADLGSSRPKVQIMLSISGTGQVLEAKIMRSSGVAAMDAAAARLLAELKKVPAPPDGKPWQHDNIELDTEM